MLAQARLAVGMSQTAMAKSAGYNLCNISAVEKGKQDPGVMSALALVRQQELIFVNFLIICPVVGHAARRIAHGRRGYDQ